MIRRFARLLVGLLIIATLPAGFILGLIGWVFTGTNVLVGVVNWVILDEYDTEL